MHIGQPTARKRVWVTVGVAAKVATNKAGRQIDANDEAVSREAKAIGDARRITPVRTRRYEEHPSTN